MARSIGSLMLMLLVLSLIVVPGGFAQLDASPHMIKGDLLSIKGDI